jgi:hypothetical protein
MPTNVREAAPTGGLFHSNFTRREPVDLGRKQAEVHVQRLRQSGSQLKARHSSARHRKPQQPNRISSSPRARREIPRQNLNCHPIRAGRELIGRKKAMTALSSDHSAQALKRHSGEMPYRKWWRFESDDDVFTIIEM